MENRYSPLKIFAHQINLIGNGDHLDLISSHPISIELV